LKTYPIELRERVLIIVDEGELSREETARMFNVATFWIRKLLRQRKNTGSIAPVRENRGRKAVFDEDALA